MTLPKGKAFLIPPVRQCCCCFASVPESRGRNGVKPEGPKILAVIPYLYMPVSGKRAKLKNCARIQVCEPCLVRAIAGDSTGGAQLLLSALLQSVRNRYSNLARECEG